MASNLLKSILPLTVFAVLNIATPQAQAQRKELYVTSFGTDQVLRYDANTGEPLGALISNQGELLGADGFAFDPDGNIYISGFFSDNIIKYDGRTGEYLSTFVPYIDGPIQLLFDRDGDLLASSYGDEQTGCSALNSCSVLKFDGRTGDLVEVFADNVERADGLGVGPDGNLYVSSLSTDRVLRYDLETGEFLGVFASGGGLDGPSGFAFGPDGNFYVTSYLSSEVLKYDGNTGEFLGVFASGGSLSFPDRITFGPDSNAYVSSFFSNEVLKYDGRTGALLETFISGVSLPTDLVFVTVPECSSVLGILAFGACSGVILLRRKRRTKNSVQAFRQITQ